MGKTTEIAWATSTFNPVIGCTKVSVGPQGACENCYAESYAKRVGKDVWGSGKPRFVTSEAYWRQPLKWNEQAALRGQPWRVFCASLGDVFDNEWPDGVRERLFRLIKATPALTWMLLTKRIGNAGSPADLGSMLPLDWDDGYPNVWLGATVATQSEADRDIPKLLRTPARVRFLSMEPLLGSVNLNAIHRSGETEHGSRWDSWTSCLTGRQFDIWSDCETDGWPKIDWVIVGGESGSKARPMDPQWVRGIREQCHSAGVPFFFKQWGEWSTYDRGAVPSDALATPRSLDEPLIRVGKKLAGRMLDGREWNQFPGDAR